MDQGETLLRDLLSIEVITTLNEALCQNHKRVCPPSAQLHSSCGQARCDMLTSSACSVTAVPFGQPGALAHKMSLLSATYVVKGCAGKGDVQCGNGGKESGNGGCQSRQLHGPGGA